MIIFLKELLKDSEDFLERTSIRFNSNLAGTTNLCISDDNISNGQWRIISPTPKSPLMRMMEKTQESLKKCFNLLQGKMKVIVNDEKFDHFIRLCIILNSLTLGCEHHNQPELLTR